MCPDLANPTNGYIDYTSDTIAPFMLTTTATYRCSAGFGITGGVSPTRTCVEDGSNVVGMWSGTDLTCSGEW